MHALSAESCSRLRVVAGSVAVVRLPHLPRNGDSDYLTDGFPPKATRVFYRTVLRLAKAEPASERSQVLLSSHSPFVIVDA